MPGAIVIAGKLPPALGATGALFTGSPPAIDQSSSHVPFGIISAPVATSAPILPILAAVLPWNSPVVFKALTWPPLFLVAKVLIAVKVATPKLSEILPHLQFLPLMRVSYHCLA